MRFTIEDECESTRNHAPASLTFIEQALSKCFVLFIQFYYTLRSCVRCVYYELGYCLEEITKPT